MGGVGVTPTCEGWCTRSDKHAHDLEVTVLASDPQRCSWIFDGSHVDPTQPTSEQPFFFSFITILRSYVFVVSSTTQRT